MASTLTIDDELALVLNETAHRWNLSVEAILADLIRTYVADGNYRPLIAKDAWGERLLAMGRYCGTSLTDEQLSRENIY